MRSATRALCPLPGNRFERSALRPLIKGVAFDGMIADKTFDGNAIIADLDGRGAKVVISQHPRRTTPQPIDAEMYKWRHLIENFFCKLNNGINVLQRRRPVSTLLKREPTHMKPDESEIRLSSCNTTAENSQLNFLLSPDKIGILALEAELRGMSISAFISELITSTVKNDLFRQVLDTEITGRTPAGQPTT